jgi:hypothetical protein
MAPEISTGNYNKSIDIYAAGVILYEMLTGRVPFDGESAGEILMKHLTAPPDLSIVPPAYVPIITKALSKNPAQRYLSMAEMARAVEEIGTSASVPAAANQGPAAPDALARPAQPEPHPAAAAAAAPRGSPLAELCGSLALAAVFAFLAAALSATLWHTQSLTELSAVFFLTVSASWAVLVTTKFWARPVEDSLARRVSMLLIGALVGLHALWLDGWTFEDGLRGRGEPTTAGLRQSPLPASVTEAASYLSYFAIVFVAVRWWKLTERRRPMRFSFGPVLATSFWALLLLLIWQEQTEGAAALVVASAIVQLVSPWEPPPPPTVRRLRLRYA